MMLKNIPCKRSEEEIMLHIDQLGYGGKYDFFHLPKNRQLSANLGYGFINFKAAEDAARFEIEMTGFRFSHSSSKRCVVVPARVQGLSNILAFLNDFVINDVTLVSKFLFVDSLRVFSDS